MYLSKSTNVLGPIPEFVIVQCLHSHMYMYTCTTIYCIKHCIMYYTCNTCTFSVSNVSAEENNLLVVFNCLAAVCDTSST